MNRDNFGAWLFSAAVRNTIEHAAEVLLGGRMDYVDGLHPRAWVHEPALPRYIGSDEDMNPECWKLRDKQRHWAHIHFLPSVQNWVAITFPNRGIHEYTGTYKTLDEAKQAVEARLTR